MIVREYDLNDSDESANDSEGDSGTVRTKIFENMKEI